MFYATTDFFDKHQYNALFNKKVPQTVYDENENPIGTGYYMKYRIDNKLAKNIKVASEDSGAEVFRNLYNQDRDFYNFVTDDERMQSYFVSDKYKFKGYREARDVLNEMKMRNTRLPEMICKKYIVCSIMSFHMTVLAMIHGAKKMYIHKEQNSLMHVKKLVMEPFLTQMMLSMVALRQNHR